MRDFFDAVAVFLIAAMFCILVMEKMKDVL
jgi:hypothetical protein